ncbi:MAG: molybdopterin-dependent oxidoreductase, partial [Thermoanaerobaculia bacterium]
LESEFSGNLVEVCPTGVFTDKSLKSHYTRKWDLRTAPSICVHCALGCNITPGERYGELRRVRARYHGQVNGYFLCDRGRYGYGFVNHERRIRRPLRPTGLDQPAEAISAELALEQVADCCSRQDRLLGIGSPRASLEANFALRTLVGSERFHQGVSSCDRRLVATAVDALTQGGVRIPALRDVEQCDAVLVLGEDVTHTAPMLALALRQAAKRQPEKIAGKLRIPDWNVAAVQNATQNDSGPVYVASPAATGLDDVARRIARAAPEDLARLGFAVAHELDPEAPAVEDLGEEMRALAAEIAGALATAERPLVVAGTGCGSAAVIRAAANVAGALGRKRQHPADLVVTLPECNSMGLALLGGESLEAAFSAVADGRADTVVILENDLERRADPETVERFLSAAEHVVVIDHQAHGTGARAEILLPAATFAEADGSLVNNEGRAQRFFRVLPPSGEVRESWRWLRDTIRTTGRKDAGWQNLDDVTGALAAAVPAFQELPQAAPDADSRRVGTKIPRALHRYSGRTAVDAALDVHEPKPPDDPDSPLSFTMEGFDGPPPADLASEFWSPGWNSIQALNRFQEEVAGPLRGGDPGIRLISTASPSAEADYFTEVPGAFERRTAEWRIIPLHHIFGSEELSVLSDGIAELAPKAYLALHPDDAADLGIAAGAMVSVTYDGGCLELPARIQPELPRGVAGLPVGLPDLALAEVPRWAKLAGATP